MPIFGKIFEKLIFKSLFEYLEEQKLLSEHQSGFRPNDSCINQLLSSVHDVYTAFDANPALEVHGIFLDLSIAFEKVWHEGLIYKLRGMSISGPALKLTKSFLNNRFQRVILNGPSSNWLPGKDGVPQGYILGPLFSLGYVNDLSDNLTSTAKLLTKINMYRKLCSQGNNLSLSILNFYLIMSQLVVFLFRSTLGYFWMKNFFLVYRGKNTESRYWN